jgi:hypothetical protein
VTALYLIEHPEEVQDFNDYIDIDSVLCDKAGPEGVLSGSGGDD